MDVCLKRGEKLSHTDPLFLDQVRETGRQFGVGKNSLMRADVFLPLLTLSTLFYVCARASLQLCRHNAGMFCGWVLCLSVCSRQYGCGKYNPLPLSMFFNALVHFYTIILKTTHGLILFPFDCLASPSGYFLCCYSCLSGALVSPSLIMGRRLFKASEEKKIRTMKTPSVSTLFGCG